jgi:UDP-glucose 4-epimerase
MATVIGIFEDQYKNNKPLTLVKPGTQSRRFTHIDDTIKVCLEAWRSNKCRHYSISSKQDISLIQVAKMFGGKIKLLPERKGERYASALSNMNLTNKIYKRYGTKKLEDYIENFKNMNNGVK